MISPSGRKQTCIIMADAHDKNFSWVPQKAQDGALGSSKNFAAFVLELLSTCEGRVDLFRHGKLRILHLEYQIVPTRHAIVHKYG